MKNIILYTFLLLMINHSNIYSQQLIVRFDEECHSENSEILLDVMEDVLGEKKLKKIVKKEYKEEFIETDINTFKYDILIKVAIIFNVLGEIKGVEIDRYNNFITKRDKKKIRNYILENQPTFNVCWNNMNDLRKFLKAGVDINTIREAFYINLYRNDLWNNEYGMRVVFPGYITQEFYEKYLKGLK